MPNDVPRTTLDTRYSEEGAQATPWPDAVTHLEQAGAANRHCAVTTGCNTWNEGLDLVKQGEAVVVHDTPLLRQVADAFLAKYGSDWAFEVAEDSTFRGPLVYQLVPVQGLGFGKDPFSHTRWDFND